MPSFFEVKTGDVSVIGLFISFAVLVIGGVSTVYFEVFYEPSQMIALMCDVTNNGCGHVVEVDQEEFAEMTAMMSGGESDNAEDGSGEAGMPAGGPIMFGPMMREPPWGQAGWGITCSKCGEKQLYRAIQCDDCGKVFYRAQGVRYGDTCPDCGYSRSKTRQEKAAAEKE